MEADIKELSTSDFCIGLVSPTLVQYILKGIEFWKADYHVKGTRWFREWREVIALRDGGQQRADVDVDMKGGQALKMTMTSMQCLDSKVHGIVLARK